MHGTSALQTPSTSPCPLLHHATCSQHMCSYPLRSAIADCAGVECCVIGIGTLHETHDASFLKIPKTITISAPFAHNLPGPYPSSPAVADCARVKCGRRSFEIHGASALQTPQPITTPAPSCMHTACFDCMPSYPCSPAVADCARVECCRRRRFETHGTSVLQIPNTSPCEPLPAASNACLRTIPALLVLIVQELSVAEDERVKYMAPPCCRSATPHNGSPFLYTTCFRCMLSHLSSFTVADFA